MFGKDAGDKKTVTPSEMKKRAIKAGLIVGVGVVLIGGKVLYSDLHTSKDAGSSDVQVQQMAPPTAPTTASRPSYLKAPAGVQPPAGVQDTSGGLLPPPQKISAAPVATATMAPAVGQPSSKTAKTQEVVTLIGTASQGAATVKTIDWNGPNGFASVVYQINGGERGIAWVDLPEHLVLIGTLLNASGQDLNGPDLMAKAAGATGATAATASSASALATAYTSGQGFAEGTAGPEVTVYIDPDSLNGHRLYLGLAPLIHGGKIRVRYVPIAEKGKHSLSIAETILSAPTPVQALSKSEHLFKHRANGQYGGGMDGITPNLEMTQIVDSNTGMLAAAGYIGDPVMVYCNKSGQYQVEQGHQASLDLNAIMENIGACH